MLNGKSKHCFKSNLLIRDDFNYYEIDIDTSNNLGIACDRITLRHVHLNLYSNIVSGLQQRPG